MDQLLELVQHRDVLCELVVEWSFLQMPDYTEREGVWIWARRLGRGQASYFGVRCEELLKLVRAKFGAVMAPFAPA